MVNIVEVLKCLFILPQTVLVFCFPIQLSGMAKVVVVGDAGCGKTSLLSAFSTNRSIDKKTCVTFKNAVIDIEVNRKEVALSLWNTAGEKSENLASFGHV